MIYLDNASTTKISKGVLDSMMPYLTDYYGNAGNIYGFGERSAKGITEARGQVANFINARPEQIIFTSGGSEANNLAIQGVTNYLIKKGKTHIISSEIEHDSVLNALESMKERGFTVELISPQKCDNGWCIDENSVMRSIQREPKTGMVSIMRVNNETGITNKIESLGVECHKKDILFHTDCVQAAGCLDLNVEDLNCDFLSLSAHKIHGMKGVGALYVKDKSILNPIIFGGHVQEFGLRGGTENVPGIVGFGKACELMNDELDEKYPTFLRDKFWNELQIELNVKGLGGIVHINGEMNLDIEDRGKILNLRFDGVDGETLMMVLDSMGICVSAGSACRSHEQKPSKVLSAIGLTPEEARTSIRISFSSFNSLGDVTLGVKSIVEGVVALRKRRNYN